MIWSRKRSDIEALMVEILIKRGAPMSLYEIAEEIRRISPTSLSGQTPRKSLYSIIYRREKRRINEGKGLLFKTTEERREVLYSINKNGD